MTGLAADVVKGDTLHSTTGIGCVSYTDTLEDVWKKVKRNHVALSRLRKVKVLIIDEVSLLSAQVFTILEEVLRLAHNSALPFGGVRIGLVGDFLQLPPFYDGLSEEENSKRKGEWYCFKSPVWLEKFKPIAFYLRQNQRAVDGTYRKFIEDLSEGRLTDEALAAFESRKTTISYSTFFDKVYPGRIVICSINKRVKGVNDTMVSLYKSRLHFSAQDEFSHPASSSKAGLVAQVALKEKVTVTRNCRIMFLKKHKVKATSDMRSKVAYTSSEVTVRNGTMGTVVGFSDRGFVERQSQRAGLIGSFPSDHSLSNIEAEKAKVDWYAAEVRLDSGLSCHVALTEDSVVNEAGEILRRLQAPFDVAYAASSHKCQGSTCERVHVAISDGQMFEREQFYVVASRVKKLQDLTIDTDLCLRSMPIGPSEEVKDFYSKAFPNEKFGWRCTRENRQILSNPRVIGLKRSVDSLYI